MRNRAAEVSFAASPSACDTIATAVTYVLCPAWKSAPKTRYELYAIPLQVKDDGTAGGTTSIPRYP